MMGPASSRNHHPLVLLFVFLLPFSHHFTFFCLYTLHSQIFAHSVLLIPIVLRTPAFDGNMESRPPGQLTLTALPLEVLFMITDYLQPPDFACLALCSHVLLDALCDNRDELKDRFQIRHRDDPMWVDLNETRLSFLNQLSRDLPGYYLCYHCLKLHTWYDIKGPGEKKRKRNMLKPR